MPVDPFELGHADRRDDIRHPIAEATHRVRLVILSATAPTSIVHVAGSTSTNTGRAPQYPTAFAQAMYVSVGTMTSSPGPTPAPNNARCSAAVPLTHATAWSAAQNLAN